MFCLVHHVCAQPGVNRPRGQVLPSRESKRSSNSFHLAGLRVEELDVLAGQALVYRLERLQLVLGVGLVLAVKVHLGHTGGVEVVTGVLAHHLGRVDKVSEDRFVDGSESAGARARLLLESSLLVLTGKNPALGYDKNVLAAELLLQLPDQSLLDLMELGKKRDRHEDDDGLLAASYIELLSSHDVQVLKISLDLVGGDLEVKESLGNLLLELIRGDTLLLLDLLAGREHTYTGGTA
eukprot:Rmarinus@m.10384